MEVARARNSFTVLVEAHALQVSFAIHCPFEDLLLLQHVRFQFVEETVCERLCFEYELRWHYSFVGCW